MKAPCYDDEKWFVCVLNHHLTWFRIWEKGTNILGIWGRSRAQVVCHLGNIWIGPWANFPQYMDPIFPSMLVPFSQIRNQSLVENGHQSVNLLEIGFNVEYWWVLIKYFNRLLLFTSRLRAKRFRDEVKMATGLKNATWHWSESACQWLKGKGRFALPWSLNKTTCDGT